MSGGWRVDINVAGAEPLRRMLQRLGSEVGPRSLAATAEDVEQYVGQEAGKHTRPASEGGGALFRSVYMRRDGDAWEVGNDLRIAPHALFVHWGTRPHDIKPKKKGALRWPGAGGGFVFAKRVKHPGYEGDAWLVRAASHLRREAHRVPQRVQGRVAAGQGRADPGREPGRPRQGRQLLAVLHLAGAGLSMPATNFYDIAALHRDALATVPGVVTCRVGLEANMTPADYPMIRIVPSRVADGPSIGRRSVEALIYFGEPVHEFTGGLEAQWQSLAAMEQAILDKAQATGGFLYVDTILDEDRIDAYKLMAIRCRLTA